MLTLKNKIDDLNQIDKNTDEYWILKAKIDFAIDLHKVCLAQDLGLLSIANKLNISTSYVKSVFNAEVNLTIEEMVKFAIAVNSELAIKIIGEFSFALEDNPSFNEYTIEEPGPKL